MFRDTMALKTNPFGPSFPPTPGNLKLAAFLGDLDRMPLRLDECGNLLRPLFCSGILDLENHMDDFHDLMMGCGYVFGADAERSINSAFVVIRGALGSGKTTLGSWMIAEMDKLPGQPWVRFHVPEPVDDNALAALVEQIRKVPAGHHVAVLVENVSDTSLRKAIESYNGLLKWPRLFIVTTHNLKLLDADERTMGGAARIEVFTLRQMTPEDADAYVAHRIPQYRDPKLAAIQALSPVFPFSQGFAGRLIQQGANMGQVPIVLRQLNAIFGQMLVDHRRKLRDRPGLVPVDKAPVADLPNYLL